MFAISVDTEHCHYAFLKRAFPGGSTTIPLRMYLCTLARASARYNFTPHCPRLQKTFVANNFFTTVADTTKRTARDYQVLDEATGVAKRSVFVIDKIGQIRFWCVLQHHEIEHNVDSVISVVRICPSCFVFFFLEQLI